MIRLPASLSHPRPRRIDFQRVGNYRLALLSEHLRRPLRWLAARASRGVPPSEPQAWRRGVILGPSHLGDVLYNTPSLPALRAGLPECRWTYVVAGASAEVLQGNPYLEEVIRIEEPRHFRDWQAQRQAALQSRSFDVVLTYSTAPWHDLVLALRLGIPNRVGYVHRGFSGLVTQPVSLQHPQSFPAYFRDLVCQLTGAPLAAIPSLQPLVYPDAEDEEAVDRAGERLGIDWHRLPILACAVTSRQPSGVWPREKFLESIRYVLERRPCTVLYFGAADDAAGLRELARETGLEARVLAGDLNPRAMVALLRRCRAALTADSGARHLANAAGLPVVFVRNISFRYEEAGPYAETDHDMAPAEIELVPPESQAAAFEHISPTDVGNRVLGLIEGRRDRPVG